LTDSEGRFCLNDIHKVAGGNPKQAPAQWMRYDQFSELLRELENVGKSTISPMTAQRGRTGGTYVVKELVYAYAMWISPQFHLKVIRKDGAYVRDEEKVAA